jgi:hypothetical protein
MAKLGGVILGVCVVMVLAGGHEHPYASPIAHTWVKTTIKIENQWGDLGTGFLLFREVQKNRRKTFLVTNKHVLNGDPEKREAARYLKLFVNVEGNDGRILGHRFEKVPLVERNGTKLWRQHEDPYVDVLAIDISWFINTVPNLHKQVVPYADFITPELMQTQDVTIADEVLIIGYPSGLTHATTNFPLVRQGLIATRIGEKIKTKATDDNGKDIMVEIPGFLVDSTVIPGSSGSPVILKPVRGLKFTDGTNEAEVLPEKRPYLLGIISRTKLITIHAGQDKEGQDLFFPALQGLGVVYDAETIKQTIELFFK